LNGETVSRNKEEGKARLAAITPLPGWVSLHDVARRLRVSRQYAHQMVEDGTFTEVHAIPGKSPDRPSAYVVSEAQVAREEEAQRRRQPTAEREPEPVG
jgi:hypothetical protein